ncbi:helix-turn-helix domain-containing protein [Escherichia coli]|uniref:helix-turn-helix domain-containing protein n=1 Tax=Escherichia coli TaxID=562 RepID=UPI003D044A67
MTEATLLVPNEAAARLRASASTLARWRTYGGGPRYIKRKGRIFYRDSDLDAFEKENERTQTRGE